MARYTPEEVVTQMKKTGLVPVYYSPDKVQAKMVMETSYRAGIRVFEFTNRGEAAAEVFSELVSVAKGLEGMVLGIGTIWSVEALTQFIELGADFAVSPALVPGLAAAAASAGTLWIPGCGTVTEVHQARLQGAKLVKVFPGNVLGAGFVKSVKAVMPDLDLMPTGGVAPNAESLGAWFGAGVSCVGMGSKLFSKTALASGDQEQVYNDISDVLALIRSLREN